jgi:2,5-diketo-D-gluconate reductase B
LILLHLEDRPVNIYFDQGYERSFGTFPLKGEQLAAALNIAIEVGYRSIDTAQMYGNERDIGQSLSSLDVPRNKLCITTKVHPDNYSEKLFIPSIEKSLTDLRVDYVDVLLLHWPPVGEQIETSLKLLEQAYEKKLALNIGVSNYTAKMMIFATQLLDAPLSTNQVEFHPLLNQDTLLATSKKLEVPLSSYCSVARGEITKYPLFDKIGKRYGKSASQVGLRWSLQKGVSINTMSTKMENIKSNFDVIDFTLSSNDMERVGSLTTINRRLVNKDLVPWAPKWD